jgi:CHAT domain-containing protein/Tfp pilus assembly protein PilF
LFDQTRLTFVHGNLEQSQKQSAEHYEQFRTSNPDWAWRFKLLEAEAMLWRGLSQEAIVLLSDQPTDLHDQELIVTRLTLLGAAYAHVRSLDKAEGSLAEGDRLCGAVESSACAGLLRAHGVLAVESGHLDQAHTFFEQTLSYARTHNDAFLEATALLNLGVVTLQQEFFDVSVDWSEKAYILAGGLGAEDVAQTALGNLGLAYHRLGNLEKAQDMYVEAENRAIHSGDATNQLTWMTYLGNVDADEQKYSSAEARYKSALDLALQLGEKGDISEATTALARVLLLEGKLDSAKDYAGRAISVARQADNHRDELSPRLVQGQAAALLHDEAEAINIFHEIDGDSHNPASVRWAAEHSLASLYEDQNKLAEADREYRTALSTFEAARDSVHHKDSQLSFLTNAASIYDDYLHILLAHGRSNEALRWADYNRARTLTEGLGLLDKARDKRASAGPPALNAEEVARRTKSAVLFYWLGEKQSYLWAITPRKTAMFPLPAKAEIEAAAQRYRKALADPGDVLDPANEDGGWLYRTLIAPALPLLPKDAKVFVIPDGSLNNVNFETFIVSGAGSGGVSASKPHFWIEDATVTAASSLRVLAASNIGPRKHERKLLLIGNSVAPNKEYPELPKAADQMNGVARHFAEARRRVVTRAQATPAAYLASDPEQFSYIHFVAHGTASRLSPLDSAIVLSTAGGEDDFKLYARDIIRHHLRADLVTISACYSAGARAYSGEGLVGLSWAFLMAGAHNVVAALWDASDAPTEQLMNRFYDELDKGAPPDAALRAAKLSLLRGNFRNPFYWAPFQLYAGS